jgi:DNA-binding transcriptional MocR family regulator
MPDPIRFEQAAATGIGLATAICDSIAFDINAQRLLPGDALPTQRLLARRLEVSLGTVHRAYQEATQRGLIRGEVGRGCFVLETRKHSTLSRLALTPASESMIDLSRNLALASALPTELHRRIRDSVSSVSVDHYLHRDPAGGTENARAAGATWIGPSALPTTFVVAGVQLGLNAILSALTNPGDTILADALTFPGLRLAARLHHLQVIPLPGPTSRPDPDALQTSIKRHKPKLWFCVPTLQNPLATMMPERLRQELSHVANKFGLPVLEDEVYGFFAPHASSIAGRCEHGIRMVSMAKSTLAGMRVAYINTSPTLAGHIIEMIEALCWMAPPASTALSTELILSGLATQLAEWKVRELTKRLAVARQLLGRRLQCETDSSLHAWLSLPDRWNTSSFAEACRQRNVLVSPSDEFLSTSKATSPNAVRISFGTPSTTGELRGAITTLAEVLRSRPPV